MAHHLFTSESVTEGHPDKICDQVSDAILDAILAQDPNGRVACECTVTTGVVNVMGEITTECYVDIPKIVRQTVREIGYDRAKYGFDCETCAVITNIDEQSADIALGVDHSLESKQTGEDALDNGAGDQGMMFGYACDETPELMPLPISLAHKLAKRLTAVRKQELVDYLRPDGKTQVTIEYDEQNHPVRVHTVVLSTQHAPEVDMAKLRADMIELVIRPTIPAELLDEQTRYLINPTGRFVVGGPQADSGLTGRKIIVDTYGGSAPHGGGAFSGKDPTKVDRSAAYAARYVAKNIVAAGLAKRCLVQLAYAIGVAEPVSVFVDTQGTGTVPDAQISAAVQQVFDLRPTAIIRDLELSRPIYRQLAAYGHMGREELGVRWEDTDRVDALRAAVAEAEANHRKNLRSFGCGDFPFVPGTNGKQNLIRGGLRPLELPCCSVSLHMCIRLHTFWAVTKNLRSFGCGDFSLRNRCTDVPTWRFRSRRGNQYLRARSARAYCYRTTRPAPCRDTSSAPRNMPRSAASGRCGRGARRSHCARGSTAPT